MQQAQTDLVAKQQAQAVIQREHPKPVAAATHAPVGQAVAPSAQQPVAGTITPAVRTTGAHPQSIAQQAAASALYGVHGKPVSMIGQLGGTRISTRA